MTSLFSRLLAGSDMAKSIRPGASGTPPIEEKASALTAAAVSAAAQAVLHEQEQSPSLLLSQKKPNGRGVLTRPGADLPTSSQRYSTNSPTAQSSNNTSRHNTIHKNDKDVSQRGMIKRKLDKNSSASKNNDGTSSVDDSDGTQSEIIAYDDDKDRRNEKSSEGDKSSLPSKNSGGSSVSSSSVSSSSVSSSSVSSSSVSSSSVSSSDSHEEKTNDGVKSNNKVATKAAQKPTSTAIVTSRKDQHNLSSLEKRESSVEETTTHASSNKRNLPKDSSPTHAAKDSPSPSRNQQRNRALSHDSLAAVLAQQGYESPAQSEWDDESTKGSPPKQSADAPRASVPITKPTNMNKLESVAPNKGARSVTEEDLTHVQKKDTLPSTTTVLAPKSKEDSIPEDAADIASFEFVSLPDMEEDPIPKIDLPLAKMNPAQKKTSMIPLRRSSRRRKRVDEGMKQPEKDVSPTTKDTEPIEEAPITITGDMEEDLSPKAAPPRDRGADPISKVDSTRPLRRSKRIKRIEESTEQLNEHNLLPSTNEEEPIDGASLSPSHSASSQSDNDSTTSNSTVTDIAQIQNKSQSPSSKRREKRKAFRKSHNTPWETTFELLTDYKQKHGTASVPYSFVHQKIHLGKWVANQRTFYKNKKLSNSRFEALNSIGFVWKPPSERWQKPWMDHYKSLLEYADTHDGSTNVPRHYTQNKKLGMWVSRQRNRYQKHNLDAEQICLLESIDFQWDLKRDKCRSQWMEMFQKLKSYKEKNNGSIAIPNTSKIKNDKELRRLSDWIKIQRKHLRSNTMVKARSDLLASINFAKNGTLQRQTEDWMPMYEKLVQYKNRNGSTLVPMRYPEDQALSNWVRHQRRHCKRDDLRQRLDNIGFVWSTRNEKIPQIVTRKTLRNSNSSRPKKRGDRKSFGKVSTETTEATHRRKRRRLPTSNNIESEGTGTIDTDGPFVEETIEV